MSSEFLVQTNVERVETNIRDLEAIVKKDIPTNQRVRLSSHLDQNRNFSNTNYKTSSVTVSMKYLICMLLLDNAGYFCHT